MRWSDLAVKSSRQRSVKTVFFFYCFCVSNRPSNNFPIFFFFLNSHKVIFLVLAVLNYHFFKRFKNSEISIVYTQCLYKIFTCLQNNMKQCVIIFLIDILIELTKSCSYFYAVFMLIVWILQIMVYSYLFNALEVLIISCDCYR